MRIITVIIHWAYDDNNISSFCFSSLEKAVNEICKTIQDTYLDAGFLLCNGFDIISLEEVKQILLLYHSYENVNYNLPNNKILEFSVHIHSNVLDVPHKYGGFEEELQ